MAVRKIFMDHAAGEPLSDAARLVYRELADSMANEANASAIYQSAREADAQIESARAEIARCLGVKSEEIYFCSGGTEADNWALRGVLSALRYPECARVAGVPAALRERSGLHKAGVMRERSKAGCSSQASEEQDRALRDKAFLLSSRAEHHAVLNCAAALRQEGYDCELIGTDTSARVNLKALDVALDRRKGQSGLLSFMWANNESGAIQDMPALIQRARANQIYLHSDAVAAAGKIDLHKYAAELDLMSFSAHKFGGPKGVGALYIRKGTRITPLIYGGSQERALRGGTENVIAIRAMAAALSAACEDMERSGRYVAALRDSLERAVHEQLNPRYCYALPRQGAYLPGHLQILFPGRPAERILRQLDSEGFALSVGAACSARVPEPSHVLRAMGYSYADAQSVLRISLGADNTEQEIGELLECLLALEVDALA